MTQHYAVAMRSVAHAQLLRPSQAAQAGWDGAAELVGAEVAASASETLSAVKWRPSAQCAHRYCNPVRLPRLDGIVPLSWFWKRELRAQVRRLSAAQRRPAARSRTGQSTQSGCPGWMGCCR